MLLSYTTVATNGIDEKACKLGFTSQCLSEHLVKYKAGIYLKLYSMTLFTSVGIENIFC